MTTKTDPGNYFEDFGLGQVFDHPTPRTVTTGDVALYTALHRMEDRGWIAAEWGVSPLGRRAKFYRLTRAGRKQLEKESQDWQQTTDILAQFLKPSADRA